MRIGIITPGFSTSEEDWAIPVLLHLVRELAEKHEVRVFALRYPPRQATYSVYGAKVFAFGGGQRAGLQRFPLLVRALAGILAHTRRWGIDLLHGFWGDEPGFLAVTAGRLLGAPAVVSLMGGELVGFQDIGYGGQLGQVSPRLTRLATHSALKVTVGSNYLGRLAQHHVQPGKLEMLPLGVDTGLFHPLTGESEVSPLGGGRFKLLNVASLTPVKGQAILLQALSLIIQEEPEVHLHIVGEGPLRRNLEGIAEHLSVAQHVTFHGAIPHHRLPAYYRTADLLVQSSRYEGQGMAVLEGAACGCPAVGTAVGVLPDLAPAVRTFSGGDAPSWAEALLHLIRNPEERTEMARLALDKVQIDYSLDASLTRLQTLYTQLTAKG